MSLETLQIVKGMDVKRIETMIALQCAPLITGIKMSNLLIVPNTEAVVLREVLNRTGIGFYRLIITDTKTTFLLFRRIELENYLRNKHCRLFLQELGYHNMQLGYVLRIFQTNYEQYVGGKREFPHEMGVLLGYPMEDVRGFWENAGENYLYAGYWKVYANVNAKKRLFKDYEMAQHMVVSRLARKETIQNIIVDCNKNVQEGGLST